MLRLQAHEEQSLSSTALFQSWISRILDRVLYLQRGYSDEIGLCLQHSSTFVCKVQHLSKIHPDEEARVIQKTTETSSLPVSVHASFADLDTRTVDQSII